MSTTLKIKNSLTKNLEVIETSKPVSVYNCGPTVYDHAHIGNLRAFITDDTLWRALDLLGYKSKIVMNITDIDDKTLKRSHEEYPDKSRKEALSALTKKYEEIFISDLEKIGIDLTKIKLVRATDEIESMQQMIKRIVESGIGYITKDGVYLSIQKYIQSGHKYGLLANIDIDASVKSRIDNDEYDKEEARDFALWKSVDEETPGWELNINGNNIYGVPGWHIECSAMSAKYLGENFDIHTGGVDLKFPHHENEIAQALASGMNSFADKFLHNEHLLVEGSKMSKSLGNFYTLVDIITKGIDPMAFRLLVLQAHYSSKLNFTWGSLKAAESFLNKIRSLSYLRFQTSENGVDIDLKDQVHEIKEALADDLDTPKALKSVSVAIDKINERPISNKSKKNLEDYIEMLDKSLGLHLLKLKDISKDDKALMNEREAARKNKNFDKSDQLRDELANRGILINDTDHGQTWTKKQ